MRYAHSLHLVLAVAVGLGFARYRATGPEYADFYGNRIDQKIRDGVDSILAGVALVGGLGVLAERLRGKSPSPWGPGRWVWCLAAVYLAVSSLDRIVDTVSAQLWAGSFQNRISDEVMRGFRGKYEGFLIPSFGWFLLALSLTSLIARRGNATVHDGREWSGRAFAAMVVVALLCSKALTLLGYDQGEMGGGLGLLAPGG